MKVYIVERGDYSDRNIVGAFSSRKRAVAYIEFKLKSCRYPDSYAIYEMEIDEEKVVSDNNMFDVFFANGVWDARETDYIADGEIGKMGMSPLSFKDMSGVFFAKDKDHAIKMAQDVCAKMKAEEIGL